MLKRETAIELVKQYIRACIALNVKIEKAIVFGSFSKNNFNEDSDIDVALISDDFTGYPLADRKKIVKADIRFPIIESHTFSKKYFEQGDPFINEIKKTGIEVGV
jgi:uncharacterized protein